MENTNERTIRIFNEVVDSLELGKTEIFIDPHCHAPSLLFDVEFNAYRKSTGNVEPAHVKFSTGGINQMFYECEPDYFIRGFMRRKLKSSIDRINN